MASDNGEAPELSLNARSYSERLLAMTPDELVSDGLPSRSRDASGIPEADPLLSLQELQNKARIILARLDGESTSAIPCSPSDYIVTAMEEGIRLTFLRLPFCDDDVASRE